MADSIAQKPTKWTKKNSKNDPVKDCIAKVTLLRNIEGGNSSSNQIEVRRFIALSNRCTSLAFLKAKIRSLFETHLENGMKVYWRDRAWDFVRIKSDDELAIAVVEMENETYRHFFVVAEH